MFCPSCLLSFIKVNSAVVLSPLLHIIRGRQTEFFIQNCSLSKALHRSSRTVSQWELKRKKLGKNIIVHNYICNLMILSVTTIASIYNCSWSSKKKFGVNSFCNNFFTRFYAQICIIEFKQVLYFSDQKLWLGGEVLSRSDCHILEEIIRKKKFITRLLFEQSWTLLLH